MKNERDIRALINEATIGVLDDETDPFELLDLDRKIVPYLAFEAISNTLDDEQRGKLETVKDLLERREIGIAARGIRQPTGGLVEDISLDKMREAGAMEGYTLRFLINPTVTYSLQSADDLGRSVEKMKRVMLEAYDSWKELTQNRTFIPVHEIY